EPSQNEILESLLPRNLAIQIFTALLENAASEQGARMSAMDSATRNAGEMIEKLTIVYNRTRQATITKELIEIISGAEAL
ncbi:MAG TPA: F0F1 ATP synthase subunit gamma, partial [Sphingomicrobium sp.]|nr:F0F1 ATP synthase subunit gamma [Sphingomicrobium sp.]